MLTEFTIQNFKSIDSLTLSLGRFNLFIGENGSGKSNIVEAVALAAGAVSGRIDNEDLVIRGARVAPPSLTVNKPIPSKEILHINMSWKFVEEEFSADTFESKYTLIHSKKGWERTSDLIGDIKLTYAIQDYPAFKESYKKFSELPLSERQQKIESFIIEQQEILKQFGREYEERPESKARSKAKDALASFGIYCASTLALRGLQTESRREPLGLYGEGLDVAIAQLPEDLRARLVEDARLISWLEDIDFDTDDSRKLRGDKPMRSLSRLYFVDRFLSGENRSFSAENVNEGILHLLFYLTLFMHPEAPRFFAIDNIETALNPHLLRHLIKTLAQLAKTHDRQALVTTHNPAALDGLNLHDDEQRLFVVYRDEAGCTQVKRIQLKPETKPGEMRLKLSEMWMRGMLGAIPTHF